MSGTKNVPNSISTNSSNSASPSLPKRAIEQAAEEPSPQPTISNAFPFRVNRSGPHFASTLALLGAYEIEIPGDGQWHDTKILVRPSYQLQMNFSRGTEGNVNVQVDGVSGLMQQAVQNGAYYEYNFVARLRNNPFDHVLKVEDTLKLRSTDKNVFIIVDVRQGDLY